jgi:hypothetical protein
MKLNEYKIYEKKKLNYIYMSSLYNYYTYYKVTTKKKNYFV